MQRYRRLFSRRGWLSLIGLAGLCLVVAASAAASAKVNVATLSAVEGHGFQGQVATFQDSPTKGTACAAAANYTVQVSWGDGAQDSPPATFENYDSKNNLCNYSVSDSHTYAEEGSPTLTVSVAGPSVTSSPGTGSASAHVADAALSSTSANQSAGAGTQFSGTVASFTDADPNGTASDYSATINWGDGSSTSGTIGANGAGGFTVQGSHTWSSAGSYGATVTISDAGGSTTSTSFTVSVGKASPTGPIARLTVVDTAPQAGRLTTLSAAGSTSSARIISYDWDFNGDGRSDTSTGTIPTSSFMFTPGSHTVGVTVVDANGQRSTTTRTFNVGGHAESGSFGHRSHPAGCAEQLNIGGYTLVADCIASDPHTGGYTITGDPIDLNGTTLYTRSGESGTFHLAYGALTGPDVTVKLANLPVGDVVLGGLNLSSQPLVLDAHALEEHNRSSAPGLHAHAAGAASPGTRLVSFAVGHQCSHGDTDATCCPPSSPTSPAACATLPGGFPIAGQVNVYVNSHGQAIFEVEVAVDIRAVSFSASGALRITADLSTGVHLNSLQFAIPDSTFAIFNLKDTSFSYYWPDCGDPSHCDTWQAQTKINFAAVGGPELDGELDFQHGQFHHASLVLTLPPGVGVPLFPGVLLNRLGGEFGVNPLVFGGTLGASIATQLEATVSFRYREATPTELGVFGLQGTLELQSSQIAQLTFDLYTDGYIDGALDLNLHFPLTADEAHRVVTIAGHVGFWDEPSSGHYQGNGSVELKVWIIDASVAGLINQDWIAGCASVQFGPVGGGLAGGYYRPDGHVEGYPFFGSCSSTDRLTHYETAPTTTHTGGFGGHLADAAGQPMALPSTSQEEIRLTGTGGIPVVRLTAPDGRSFETSPDTGKVTGAPAQNGLPAYMSAQGPGTNQLLIAIDRPAGGLWHVEPVAGSPALAKVEIAQVLPPPTIHVHVRRLRGGREALSYRAGDLAGGRLQLVARGHDSAQVLLSTTRSSGKITFRPADALGRSRVIEADLVGADGMPVEDKKVGSFLAPPAIRAGRPGHVRIVRRGSQAVITWSPAAHATHYLVTVRGSDGRVEQHFTSARKRRVVIHEVLAFERFRVAVVAYGGANGLTGPAGRATLKRHGKAPHRL